MTIETPLAAKRSFLRLWPLWLVIVVGIAPFVLSYLAYYAWQPAGRTHHGELQAEPLPEGPLALVGGGAFRLEQLRGRWVLLMADDARCDESCVRTLYALRQLRLTQGKDAPRIERVWLLTDAREPPAGLLEEYAGTWAVRGAGSALLARLAAAGAADGFIYLIDPLGNLVVRYPRETEPRGIIKDLVRLLKTSRIG